MKWNDTMTAKELARKGLVAQDDDYIPPPLRINRIKDLEQQVNEQAAELKQLKIVIANVQYALDTK